MLFVAASPLDKNALLWIVACAPVQPRAVPHSAFLDTRSSTTHPSHSRTLTLKPYVLSPFAQERPAAEPVRAPRLPSITSRSSLTPVVERTTSRPHWSAKSGAATSTA